VPVAPNRLSVVLSTKGELERETGLEPATFSLEGVRLSTPHYWAWDATQSGRNIGV
jgi:hypothetical protein